MDNKQTALCALMLMFTAAVMAEQPKDSLRTVDLQNIEIVSSTKEQGTMRQQPAAVSMIDAQLLNDNHITSLKGVAQVVPNLFIPDYGSRLTSAMYIRGIGSRLNTPSVGLYVDNMPYFDKSAFDFSFADIERIDVLRGPQGTLYGRNTMGGIVNIYTRNPMFYQGTDADLSFSSRDSRGRVRLTHYARLSDVFALSVGAYSEKQKGLFRNAITGNKVDDMMAAGGKVRAVWVPTSKLSFDFNVNYDYTDEGGYPYFYTGDVNAEGTQDADYEKYIGKITNNHENRYRRSLLNTALNVGYNFGNVKLNAVTSYQHISDRMFLDQDFLAPDIYTLEQKQRINTISEEVTLRSNGDRRWQWVNGISVMKQWLHTTGPVTFMNEGLRWLEGNINGMMPKSPAMSIDFRSDNLVMGGVFDTPVFNIAAFHQSTVCLVDRLYATVGLRLQYERDGMDYDAPSSIDYGFKMPQMGVDLNLHSDINEYHGTMKNNSTKLLPKFALKYAFDEDNNVYASVSRGMRSGGYNVQMFSDVLQGAMMAKMMAGVKEGTFAYLDNSPQWKNNPMLPMIKGNIEKAMPKVEMPGMEQVRNLIEYKPEYLWNYELGTHLTLADKRLKMDAAVFYINTTDQQIARFASSYGFGRQMVNAGKSESYGAELSLAWAATKALMLSGNYGYTHAKFTDYDAGTTKGGEDVNYNGNYVPYVPQHTFNVDAAYTWRFKSESCRSLTIGANCSGAGKMYWTESNSQKQNIYALLGMRLMLETNFGSIQLWAKNVTNTRYNTFYFESASRGFEQHGRPFQMGIDLRFKL